MRYCGEDIGAVRCSPLDAVPMVNSSLTSLVVHIKVLKIIIKVNRSSTQISPQESGVSGENSGDVNMALAAKRDCQPGQPFVEMTNDSLRCFSGSELRSMFGYRMKMC